MEGKTPHLIFKGLNANLKKKKKRVMASRSAICCMINQNFMNKGQEGNHYRRKKMCNRITELYKKIKKILGQATVFLGKCSMDK